MKCGDCLYKGKNKVMPALPSRKGKAVWIIGKSPSEKDIEKGTLFNSVGGKILKRLLKEVDFYSVAKDILFTYACLCFTDDKSIPAKVLKCCSEHLKELAKDFPPTLIIALGNTPCKALGLNGTVEQLRQEIRHTHLGRVLVTYNPDSYFQSRFGIEHYFYIDIVRAVLFLKGKQRCSLDNIDIKVLLTKEDIENEFENIFRLPKNTPISIDVETSIPLTSSSVNVSDEILWLTDGINSSEVFSIAIAYKDKVLVLPYEGIDTLERLCYEEQKKYFEYFGVESSYVSILDFKEHAKRNVNKKTFPKLSPQDLKKIIELIGLYEKSKNNRNLISSCLKRLTTFEHNFIGHNTMFEMIKLNKICNFRFKTDTLILTYLINENLTGFYSLEKLISIFFDEFKDLKRNSFIDSFFTYNAMDAYMTLLLYERLLDFIPQHQKNYIFNALDFIMNKVVPVALELTLNGIRVDTERARDMHRRINTLKEKILDIIEHLTFQRSTKNKGFREVVRSFYEYPCKLTKNQDIALDEETLNEIYNKTSNETLKKIILYKVTYDKLERLDKVYLRKLISSEKLYPYYKVTGTKTGRITAQGFPYQIVPKEGLRFCPNCLILSQALTCENCGGETEYDFNIYSLFLPDSKENVLLQVDYKQMEVAVLAHLSSDEKLITAVNEYDIHSLVASKIFNIPYHDFILRKETPEYAQKRKIAKTVVFGIIYGLSPYGLSKTLSVSQEYANQIINDFFREYKRVKEYIEEVKRDVLYKGYLVTPVGRIKRFMYIDSNILRTAVNFLVQSFAADLVHYGVFNLLKYSNAYNFKARGLIFDSVVIEVPKENLPSVKSLITNCLTNDVEEYFNLKVKLAVDFEEK